MLAQKPDSRQTKRSPNLERSGFTLLELLLAMAIAGFVLASAATLVVSVSNIWSDRQDSYFFEEHVDGVTEFLQASFYRAGLSVKLGDPSTETIPETAEQGDPNQNGDTKPNITVKVGLEGDSARDNEYENSNGSALVHVAANPIRWAKPPGFASYRDPLLNLTLNQQAPLLVNLQNAPTLGVEVFLHFEQNEGLSLLWYSQLQEEAEDEGDLRRTILSPYAQRVDYVYWDERFERWEDEDEPLEGDDDELRLPRYLKLVFEYEGVTTERTIALPVVSRSAILF